MAYTPYHNIDGAAGVDVELLAPGDNAGNIKSISFANTGADSAVLTVFLQDDPSSGSTNTFNLIYGVNVPIGTTLLLNDSSMLRFDNSSNGYGLYITVGSSDTLDVTINK